ncbi:glycosyl transferase [Fragilaria crotonensis]|nr:glycosyl transferase [Fragilaria crotonensis]
MDPSILSRVSSFLGQNQTTAATAGFLCSSPSQTHTELTTDAAGRFNVFIFTKDRPWQLQQLLLSMKLDKIGDSKVYIIANVRPDFEDGYRQVQHEFTDQIDFLVESTDRTFRMHLVTVIHAHVGETHLRWMFLTDDCILLEPLNDVLEKSGSSDIFLTRLHPGITWCQTRNLPSPAPKKHLRYQTACFTYPLSCGRVDWAYPWDLSGGIYSNELVQNVLQQCDEEETSHPNKLELAGYAILRKMPSPIISVPQSPTLLILTVNRVQDICSAPVENAKDPIEMLTFLKEGKRLDFNAYRTSHFNSSHIGVLCFAKAEPLRTFDLSVLMPVRTGPPNVAKLAARSIIMQCKDQSAIHTMQVIVVDDRCTDGSIDAIVAAAKDAARELQKDIAVEDHRFNHAIDGANSEIKLEIYASEKPGVAAALNLGLHYARSEFVARMDADDVCAEKRFVLQLEYLRCNSSLAVVGTYSAAFSASVGGETLAGNECRIKKLPFSRENDATWRTRTSFPPTDPGFVPWAMLFSCCLSHPSVMFRKAVIMDAGGYRENLRYAEDYDMWLRLTQSDPRSVVSIPYLGLWHRKHHGISEKTALQKKEADCLALQKINEYVETDGTPADVFLRRPELAEMPSGLDHAAHLLLRLASEFRKKLQHTITGREMELIEFDCKERLAEIAALSLTKFGDPESQAWRLWCDLCPERALEQVALLCHVQSCRDSIT